MNKGELLLFLGSIDRSILEPELAFMVADAKSNEAVSINGKGILAQVDYLLECGQHDAQSLENYFAEVLETYEACEICGRSNDEAALDGCRCDFHKPEGKLGD